MQSEKLKPCPFCSGNDLRFRLSDIEGWIAHVECTDCDDMLGPMSKYKHDDKEDAEKDAAEVWNNRPALEAALSTDAEPVKTAPAVAVKALADAYQKYLDAVSFYNERHAVMKTKALGTMRVDEEYKAIDVARRAFDKLAVEVATSALSAQVQDVARDLPTEFEKWWEDAGHYVGGVVKMTYTQRKQLAWDAFYAAAAPAAKQGEGE